MKIKLIGILSLIIFFSCSIHRKGALSSFDILNEFMPYVGLNEKINTISDISIFPETYDTSDVVSKKLYSIYGSKIYSSELFFSEMKGIYKLDHYFIHLEYGSEIIVLSSINDSIVDSIVLYSETGDGGDFFIVQSKLDKGNIYLTEKMGQRYFTEPYDTAIVFSTVHSRVDFNDSGKFELVKLKSLGWGAFLTKSGTLPWDCEGDTSKATIIKQLY